MDPVLRSNFSTDFFDTGSLNVLIVYGLSSTSQQFCADALPRVAFVLGYGIFAHFHIFSYFFHRVLRVFRGTRLRAFVAVQASTRTPCRSRESNPPVFGGQGSVSFSARTTPAFAGR